MLYHVGRALQLIGLLTMPSAMWIAEFQHNEAAAISVFAGSGFIFLIGLFLTRLGRPK